MIRALLRNLVAIGLMLGVLVTVSEVASRGWYTVGNGAGYWFVLTSLQAMVGLLGAAGALWLRARPAGLFGAWLAAVAIAKLTIRTVYDAPAAVGAPAQFALMLCGFLGVVLGAVVVFYGARFPRVAVEDSHNG